MKLTKKLFTCFALIVFGLGMISCSKTDLNPIKAANPDESVNANELLAKRPWGANYHWGGGSDWKCYNLGANCFDVIEIEPTALGDLDGSISNGSSGVKSFFSDKSRWTLVFPDLNSSANKAFLTKLQSGSYTMIKHVSGISVLYVATGGSPVESFAFQVVLK